MCIRDSANTVIHSVCSEEMSGKVFAALEFVMHLAFLLAMPVSYTHLRAHETVLDLVCRLLLEKKQHHHTYILEKRPTTDGSRTNLASSMCADKNE